MRIAANTAPPSVVLILAHDYVRIRVDNRWDKVPSVVFIALRDDVTSLLKVGFGCLEDLVARIDPQRFAGPTLWHAFARAHALVHPEGVQSRSGTSKL